MRRHGLSWLFLVVVSDPFWVRRQEVEVRRDRDLCCVCKSPTHVHEGRDLLVLHATQDPRENVTRK